MPPETLEANAATVDDVAPADVFRPTTPANLGPIETKIAVCMGEIPFMHFLTKEDGAHAGRGTLSTYQRLGTEIAGVVDSIDEALDGKEGILTPEQTSWLRQTRVWALERVRDYGAYASKILRHFGPLADGSRPFSAEQNGTPNGTDHDALRLALRELIGGYAAALQAHPVLCEALDPDVPSIIERLNGEAVQA